MALEKEGGIRKLQGTPPRHPPQCCARCWDPVGWDLGLVWQGALGVTQERGVGAYGTCLGGGGEKGTPPPPPRNGLQQLANAPTVADVLGERTPVSYTWKPQEPAPC